VERAVVAERAVVLELLAVVGHDRHDRAALAVAAGQCVEDAPDVLVGVADLAVVQRDEPREVARQQDAVLEPRHLVEVHGLEPAAELARTVPRDPRFVPLVGTVRREVVQPQEPRAAAA
jgi:hypothetical protein